MTFKRTLPPRRDRSDEFSDFVPRPRGLTPIASTVKMAIAIDQEQYSAILKTRNRKRQDIRDAARGEECQIRLPGCDGGGDTTVWCHLPEAVAGRGMGLKGIDLLGAFGCRSCHDIVDRRAPRPGRMTEHDVALVFYRALARSLVRLEQRGLL